MWEGERKAGTEQSWIIKKKWTGNNEKIEDLRGKEK